MRRPSDVCRLLSFLLVVCVAALGADRADATPALTMDVATGDVLYQQDATQPWFPASTTKLMTVYVALSAVRDHQIAMNTPLVVSARAHKMPPSKMGFAVGTQVTLDNALKMLMVRSANDVAITVAEGIGGSVEGFADDMNRAAAQLGMRESHFVNPNGLPAADHYSSARDMAILARALYTEFPDETGLFNLGELSLGAELIPNHNNLLGRYPGADGMKTGFTCAAGFNVVASAFRDGRRIVVVVFGAPSVATRTEKVAALFDRAFANVDRPNGSVQSLVATGGGPPDMHGLVCQGARVRLIAQFRSEVEQLDQPLQPGASTGIGLPALNPAGAMLFGSSASSPASPSGPTAERITTMPLPVFDPVPVRVGADPGYTGVVAEARAAHTPVGTSTPPVTAEAYAAPATLPVVGAAPLSPLQIDPTALPLRGRRAKLARLPHRGRVGMKAAAEAPKTRILAGAEGESEAPAEPGPRKSAAKAKPHATAHAKKADKPREIGDGGDAANGKKAAKKVETKKVEAKKADKPHKAAGKKPEQKKVAKAKSKADAAN